MGKKRDINLALKLRIIEEFGSQGEFAVFAKVPPSTVSQAINKKIELPPTDRERWARALRTDVDAIFPCANAS